MEIYAITDVNGAIRYVGQARDAAKRLNGHWRARRSLDLKLYQWMRTLDEPPSWHILAVVEDELANSTERRFIIGARVAFPDLNLNVRARGGWSPEWRAKQSQALKGRVVSPETRAKLSASNRGQKRSPEHVEMMRQRATALWADPEYRQKTTATHRSPESRAKQAAAIRGQRRSDETKAKIAATKRAQWADPEYRQKTTEAHIGQTQSAETIAKRSVALRAAWGRRHREATSPEPTRRSIKIDAATEAAAAQRIADGAAPKDLAAELGVSLRTLYRSLRRQREANDAD